MNILVAFKVVLDDQDIQANADGTLDYSKARPVISDYDLNAIEAAAQLAAAKGDAKVIALTVGGAWIDESKLKKNVLSRGVDELLMLADDACDGLDSHATAQMLADLVRKTGDWAVVFCGDGSADDYDQQVDVQLACELGVPVVTAASSATIAGNALEVERVLENAVQVVEAPMPCVVSVTPDAATPRIPGMKDILAAGKKPMEVVAAATPCESVVVAEECKVPERAARKLDVRNASADGALEGFAAALKAAL